MLIVCEQKQIKNDFQEKCQIYLYMVCVAYLTEAASPSFQ